MQPRIDQVKIQEAEFERLQEELKTKSVNKSSQKTVVPINVVSKKVVEEREEVTITLTSKEEVKPRDKTPTK